MLTLIIGFIALLCWATYQYSVIYIDNSLAYWTVSKVFGWALVFNTLLFIFQPSIYSPEYAHFVQANIDHPYKKSLLGAQLPLYLLIFASLCLTFPSVLKYKLSPRYGDLNKKILSDFFFTVLGYFLVFCAIALVLAFGQVLF